MIFLLIKSIWILKFEKFAEELIKSVILHFKY